MSAEVQAARAAFARKGVPGSDDKWRPYADGGKVTLLDSPFALVDEIRDDRCAAVGELVRA